MKIISRVTVVGNNSDNYFEANLHREIEKWESSGWYLHQLIPQFKEALASLEYLCDNVILVFRKEE